MCEYFPQPKSLGANLKVDLDLCNYATKAEFKNATGADTKNTKKFAKKMPRLIILKMKYLISIT